jgi:hypothetical protein
MADAGLYGSDILAWSEQQADVLRSLAGRRDMPNDLDLSHVVEEIEDVGLSQVHAASSFIRLIMTHAIKCWAIRTPQVCCIGTRKWAVGKPNWLAG